MKSDIHHCEGMKHLEKQLEKAIESIYSEHRNNRYCNELLSELYHASFYLYERIALDKDAKRWFIDEQNRLNSILERISDEGIL